LTSQMRSLTLIPTVQAFVSWNQRCDENMTRQGTGTSTLLNLINSL
jgi:hypothetical protein